MSRPRVVVVLPVHNRRDTTLRALRSLARLDRSTADVEVIVVDDGSTDGTTAAIAAQSPDVTVVPGNGSLFYAAGTNLGVTHALERHPDFIVIANDDAVFSSGCVRELVHCAQAHPRRAIRYTRPHRRVRHCGGQSQPCGGPHPIQTGPWRAPVLVETLLFL